MYIATVIGLMLVCPVVSIVLEVVVRNHDVFETAIAEKWFVFWAMGVRLLLAGLRQIVQPRYTAQVILGIKNSDAMLIVRELGIANTAIGSAGVASIMLSGWIMPIAVIGVIFYGLAAVNHMMHAGRNTLQNVAMISDIFAATVLLIFAIAR
jgi:hypothetical protein